MKKKTFSIAIGIFLFLSVIFVAFGVEAIDIEKSVAEEDAVEIEDWYDLD